MIIPRYPVLRLTSVILSERKLTQPLQGCWEKVGRITSNGVNFCNCFR